MLKPTVNCMASCNFLPHMSCQYCFFELRFHIEPALAPPGSNADGPLIILRIDGGDAQHLLGVAPMRGQNFCFHIYHVLQSLSS